ncbi:MAG: hypothetical protein KZQ78_07395 [Candidatus Thiodiazotropha sp. (ex Ustalcina ferruginea)]|nr:hypothetical protein [Candidatus Thiodiazotropha sp. (ex Ustalcina ferruginea)]
MCTQGQQNGTILSGLVYQLDGLIGCLWWSAGFVLLAAVLSFGLPELQKEAVAEE